MLKTYHHLYLIYTECCNNRAALLPGAVPAHRQQNDNSSNASFPQQNNSTRHWLGQNLWQQEFHLATTAHYHVVKIASHSPVILNIWMLSWRVASTGGLMCLSMGKYHWYSGWLDKSYCRVARSSAIPKSEYKQDKKNDIIAEEFLIVRSVSFQAEFYCYSWWKRKWGFFTAW